MPLTHLLLLLVVIAFWGFNFVAIKVGVTDMPPIFFACIRFFLTGLPALFFVKKPDVPFSKIALYGLVMFALQFALLFVGMRAGVTAGMASLLLQLQAVFTIIFAAIFLKEQVHRWQIIGMLVSFAGIGVVGINLDADMPLFGVVLAITASALWSAGSFIAKSMGKIDMLGVIVWGGLVAWPPLLIASLILEGPDQVLASLVHLNWPTTLAILYNTVFATFFGFGVWNWMLNRHPISIVAPFTLLVPVFGMLSSVVVLGEILHLWKIVAAVLVVGGVCINLFGARLRQLVRG